MLTRMANYWANQSNDVSIVILDHSRHLSFYSLHPNVDVTSLDLLQPKKQGVAKLIILANQLITVRRQLVKKKPEVVIAFLDITIFLALVSTRFLNIKVIVSERNNPYRNSTNRWLQRMNNYLYSLADSLVLQTGSIAATFPSTYHSKISVIANPIPPPVWEVTNYSAQYAKKTVVAIGRLTPQKGFDMLIRAFAQFVHKHTAWQLRIVGTGEEEHYLAQLCEELSVTHCVLFPGSVTDIEEVFSESSLFVLSSRFEGFPNTLCEAMAVGLPVIATRCEFGPEEIVRHEENGLLVPAEDVGALTEALDKLVSNPQLGEQLGANARTITHTLSVDKIMQQWETLICAL